MGQPITWFGSSRLPPHDLLDPATFYEEMRRLARQLMAGQRPDHTLQPTALANEAYIRIAARVDELRGCDLHQAIDYLADTMRSILVDHARQRGTAKRGAHLVKIPFDSDLLLTSGPTLDVLIVEELLDRLQREDPPVGRIVKLRFFVGLTTKEIARAMGITEDKVEYDWGIAKKWLVAHSGGHE